MTQTLHSPVEERSNSRTRATAVISGSYRRGVEQLRKDYSLLQIHNIHILSPVSLDFVDEVDGFVRACHEKTTPPEDIESGHLSALGRADFVWLHAPDGYLGTSGAVELGYAIALGVPIFTTSTLADAVFRSYVQVVDTAADLPDEFTHRRVPAHGLQALQRYYDRVARQRGYEQESPQDTMLLLTEEVGELARAVRLRVGLKRAPSPTKSSDLNDELADVMLYLLHLANIVDVDLASATVNKEVKNAQRAAT